jgi:hypothetical protein
VWRKALQFLLEMVENYEVGPEGSSIENEPPGPLAPDEVDQGLTMREPYLRRVLAEFEAGRLEAYDYTRRVLAINTASTAEEMSAIIGWLPDGSSGAGGAAARRGLDAVDLALLRSSRSSTPRGPTTRYVALAIVFLLFAVLIGVGMWLSTHVHPASFPSRVTIGRLVAAASR